MAKSKALALAHVDPRILTIRSERVMLDRDLAEVYGVTTKALNQAVKRNEERFPSGFRFQLTREERDEVVTNCDHLRERSGGLGPLAPRRDAGTYDDRMSARRGDARGVGYRKARHFLRNYADFHEHSQPHSPLKFHFGTSSWGGTARRSCRGSDMAGKKTTQREPQRPSGATSTTERSPVPAERIESAILVLRGHRVILDEHLAALYEVEVKVLNQAVRRNLDRFPDDFMFQLSTDEAAFLRSQTVTLKAGRGRHRKYLPYAFTEQGVAMLSSVLRSKQAVAVNIEIMRAFVRIRELIAGREDLILRLDALEARYDAQFSTVFDAIRALISDEARPRRRIGFQSGERKGSS